MTENQRILRGVSLGRKTLFFRLFLFRKMSRAATFARRPHDCKTDRKQGKKKYSMRLQTKKWFPASQAPQETSKKGIHFLIVMGARN